MGLGLTIHSPSARTKCVANHKLQLLKRLEVTPLGSSLDRQSDRQSGCGVETAVWRCRQSTLFGNQQLLWGCVSGAGVPALPGEGVLALPHMQRLSDCVASSGRTTMAGPPDALVRYLLGLERAGDPVVRGHDVVMALRCSFEHALRASWAVKTGSPAFFVGLGFGACRSLGNRPSTCDLRPTARFARAVNC